jgi:translocation and assembly module TamB
VRARAVPVFVGSLIAVAVLVGLLTWAVVALATRAREMAVVGLSAALGRQVRIDALSGDPWRGFTLEDVEIPGETPGEPLITARRVTVHVDVRALVDDLLRRRVPSDALSQVTIEGATVRLTRNRAGRWNILELLPAGAGGGAGGRFRGRVIVVDSVVEFRDLERIAPAAFAARFEDVSATGDFSRPSQIGFRASLVEARRGQRVPGRVTGRYHLDTGLLDVDIGASGADLGAWGPYVITTPALRVTGGRADASLHVLRTRIGRHTVLDYSGRVTARGVVATAPSRQVRVIQGAGVLEIRNQNFTTRGATGVVNGVPVRVVGEVSLHGEPWIDLAVHSNAANITAIGRLAFPQVASRVSGVARGDVRLIGPIGNLHLSGRIDQARGLIDRKPFEQASGDFAMSRGVLAVQDATGTVAGARVAGDVRWSLAEPRYDLALRFDHADLRDARQWLPPGLPVIDGKATGSIVASRRADATLLAGEASVANGRFRGESIDRLDAFFRLDPRGVALDHVVVRSGAARAAATGTVDRAGRLSLHAFGRTADLASLPWLPLPQGVTGAGNFAGRVAGTLEAPEAIGTVQLIKPRYGALAFDSASAAIAARRDHVSLRDARARVKTDIYTASGTVGWGPRTATALDIRTERASAAWLATAIGAGSPPPIDGIVEGRVLVEGTLPRPRASGSLALRDGRILGQGIDRAAGAFRWDGRRLVVEGGSATRGRSEVHLSGVIDRVSGLALDVNAPNLDLNDLTLPTIGATRVEGHVDLTGQIRGTAAAPTLSLLAESRNLLINGARFDTARGVVQWERQVLRFDPLTLQVANQKYEIAGEVRLGSVPQLALGATVEEGRLSTLLALGGGRLGVPLDGTVSGRATLEGAVGNPGARLDLRLTAGRLGDHPIEGQADLVLRDGNVSIETFDLRSGEGRIAATGRYDLRGESDIEVSGTDLALDVVRPLLRLRQPLLGRLNFTIQLGGTAAMPQLGLDVEVTRGGIEGATFDTLVASGFYRDGVLQLQQGLLVQDGHKLRASGSVPVNARTLRPAEGGPLDLRFTLADVNLTLLRLLTNRVEEASGEVTGELRVGGTVAAPQAVGTVRVANGSLRVRGVRTPIEALRLEAAFNDSTLRVSGAARAGGGTLDLNGAGRLVLGGSPFITLLIPQETPLVLNAAGVRLQAPPYVDALLEGVLRLTGTLGDARRPPVLAGRMRLSDGTIAFTGTEAAPAPGLIPAARPTPVAQLLQFDALQLEVGRDLAVQAGGVRFLLRPDGSVILGGTMRAPTLEGTIETQRGAIMALGNSFDVEEGSATFRPTQGVRPQVNARAVTHVGATRITAYVTGTAPDALVIRLESSPELSQQEITALLGRQAGVTQLLAGDVQGALRAELTRRLFAPITLALGRAIGLAEFAIEYDFERPLSLRVGKALLPELYISATTTFADRTRLLWALEYRFARNWELTLRVDADGRRELLIWHTLPLP